MQTIETQFIQYHVTKVGGGLEPLGPIGVYAYGLAYGPVDANATHYLLLQ